MYGRIVHLPSLKLRKDKGGRISPDTLKSIRTDALFSFKLWAHSSVVERCPDKTEVVGPIPTAPTDICTVSHQFLLILNLSYRSKKIQTP